MAALADDGEGFIVRTAAVGASAEALEGDRDQLRDASDARIKDGHGTMRAPCCLHEDIDPVLRVLRDQALDDIDAVRVDDERRRGVRPEVLRESHAGDGGARERLMPVRSRCSNNTASRRRSSAPVPAAWIWISGGSLVIETTEALTSIDVKSGRFDGGDLEQMAHRTNCEAADGAARQIRLRNISGLDRRGFHPHGGRRKLGTRYWA